MPPSSSSPPSVGGGGGGGGRLPPADAGTGRFSERGSTISGAATFSLTVCSPGPSLADVGLPWDAVVPACSSGESIRYALWSVALEAGAGASGETGCSEAGCAETVVPVSPCPPPLAAISEPWATVPAGVTDVVDSAP